MLPCLLFCKQTVLCSLPNICNLFTLPSPANSWLFRSFAGKLFPYPAPLYHPVPLSCDSPCRPVPSSLPFQQPIYSSYPSLANCWLFRLPTGNLCPYFVPHYQPVPSSLLFQQPIYSSFPSPANCWLFCSLTDNMSHYPKHHSLSTCPLILCLTIILSPYPFLFINLFTPLSPPRKRLTLTFINW